LRGVRGVRELSQDLWMIARCQMSEQPLVAQGIRVKRWLSGDRAGASD
jgi:hypothetical protein